MQKILMHNGTIAKDIPKAKQFINFLMKYRFSNFRKSLNVSIENN
jgi:hypothetical protein